MSSYLLANDLPFSSQSEQEDKEEEEKEEEEEGSKEARRRSITLIRRKELLHFSCGRFSLLTQQLEQAGGEIALQFFMKEEKRRGPKETFVRFLQRWPRIAEIGDRDPLSPKSKTSMRK